jgi:hypothetical protein
MKKIDYQNGEYVVVIIKARKKYGYKKNDIDYQENFIPYFVTA